MSLTDRIIGEFDKKILDEVVEKIPPIIESLEAVPSAPPPICFVMRANRELQLYQRRQLMNFTRNSFAGTKYADVPILVLDPVLTFEVLRSPPDIGELVNAQDALSGRQFSLPQPDAVTNPLPPPADCKDPMPLASTVPEESPSRDS